MAKVNPNRGKEITNTRQKALELNLDQRIYGTIAEIGAGQETSRHFFRAGGASGTIAKTMSAYDMAFSDAIYGKEESGRYVCESRLHKMLNHEFDLLIERLEDKRVCDTAFFSFANTVATKKYQETADGHGWLGVKFQPKPCGPASEVVIHVRLLDEEILSQQSTLGIIGVNLLHACYHKIQNPEEFVLSLMDGLTSKRIEIDMIRVEGEGLKHFDSRLLGFTLVKHNMTEAVIFDPQGNVLQPAEVLYKKNIFALRGSFRPPTLVNIDMLEKGKKQFLKEEGVTEENSITLCELTVQNLKGQTNLDRHDFMARVDLLAQLGQMVLVSNKSEYYRLSKFFARYTKNLVVMALGTFSLVELYKEDYYKDLWGGLLESIGRLFSKRIKLYVYPIRDEKGEYVNSHNLPLPKSLKYLHQYLLENEYIVDFETYDKNVHHIFSRDILKKIESNDDSWIPMVPKVVAKTIIEKKLFGHS